MPKAEACLRQASAFLLLGCRSGIDFGQLSVSFGGEVDGILFNSEEGFKAIDIPDAYILPQGKETRAHHTAGYHNHFDDSLSLDTGASASVDQAELPPLSEAIAVRVCSD